MLLLDHGFLPHLRARCALQHAIPAAELNALLRAMGALPPPNDVGVMADVATSSNKSDKDASDSGVPEGDSTHKGDSKSESSSKSLVEAAAASAAAAAGRRRRPPGADRLDCRRGAPGRRVGRDGRSERLRRQGRSGREQPN